MESIEVRVVVPDADSADEQAARDVFQRESVEIIEPQDDRFEVLTVIAAVLAGVAAVRAIADLSCRLKAGVIVDARKTPVVVTKDDNLPRGKVVLLDAKGGVAIENCGHDDLKTLIEGAVEAVG